MLKLTIPGVESYDEIAGEFVTQEEITITLEHSLVSLSKWESIFEKPFLGDGEKTDDELLAYVDAMILEPDFPPGVLSRLTDENIDEVNNYINKKQTATWFNEPANNKKAPETITSELIYFWMISYRIPLECEKWPLNRLFTLLKVFDDKNNQKKKTPQQIRAERHQLNEERKKKLNTSG